MPGHPPIDLDDIVGSTSELWDRKGIAYLDYEPPSGEQGEIKLDDFVYDRPPTDQIYERIAGKFAERTTRTTTDDA